MIEQNNDQSLEEYKKKQQIKWLNGMINNLNNEIKMSEQSMNQYDIMNKQINKAIEKLIDAKNNLNDAHQNFKKYYSSKANFKEDMDFKDAIIDISKIIESLKRLLEHSNKQINRINYSINLSLQEINKYKKEINSY